MAVAVVVAAGGGAAVRRVVDAAVGSHLAAVLELLRLVLNDPRGYDNDGVPPPPPTTLTPASSAASANNSNGEQRP